MKKCPCHSGLEYTACCKPFHDGVLPGTALQLMRSRYAAYALHLPDYIIKTTHTANPHYLANIPVWQASILEFSKHSIFCNLKILDQQEKGDTATVSFTVSILQGNHDATFSEKSTFVKIKGQWLYKNGIPI